MMFVVVKMRRGFSSSIIKPKKATYVVIAEVMMDATHTVCEKVCDQCSIVQTNDFAQLLQLIF